MRFLTRRARTKDDELDGEEEEHKRLHDLLVEAIHRKCAFGYFTVRNWSHVPLKDAGGKEWIEAMEVDRTEATDRETGRFARTRLIDHDFASFSLARFASLPDLRNKLPVRGDVHHLDCNRPYTPANLIHAADLELVQHHARPCATEQGVVSASRDQHSTTEARPHRTGSTAAHWRRTGGATAAWRRTGGARRWRWQTGEEHGAWHEHSS